MKFANIRRVMILLALIAVSIHLWNLLPSPSTATHAVMSDLVEKGTTLSKTEQDDLRNDMYEMFVLNRAVDTTLAVLAAIVAVAAYRAKASVTALMAATYSIINIFFLFFSWGMFEHGAYNILKSMLFRMSYGIQHYSFISVAEQSARLFTLLLAISVLVILGVRLIRRKAGLGRNY